MKLAFVTPRYGRDIVGGAETLVRDYAEHLAAQGHAVEVLTTCSRDHFSWTNTLPAGESHEAGVRISRFPVTRPKDGSVMYRLETALGAGLRLSRAAQWEWVANTGVSEPLLDAIARKDDVDAVLFAPYLFASTVFGAAVHPERSIIIPCLHDEPYAQFSCTQETLRGAAGLIFISDAEKATAAQLLGALPTNAVVGVGFDTPASPDAAAFRGAHRLPGNLVSYAGRREAGKNFPMVLESLAVHGAINRDLPLDLVVMGSGEYALPQGGDNVVDLGFVDDTTKLGAFAASVAVTNLSLNESFSYVLMEAWMAGTPVIVHSDCAVTREHCEASGGGVWISSPEAWSEAVTRLVGDADLRTRMAAAGRRYVAQNYNWSAVTARLTSAISEIMA